MNAAIEAIQSQIKSKRAALKNLKEKEAELKRLQEAVAALPKIHADLSALERSLAILKGEEVPQPTAQTNLREIIQQLRQEGTKEASIPNLVYRVLKESGKPLTTDQIMPLLAAHGKHASKQVVMGAIYRNIKQGKLFRLVAPGTFGLLEWPALAQ